MSHKTDIVKTVEDLKTDISGTHHISKHTRNVDPAVHEADWKALQTSGYVMMKNLISAERCDELKDELMPLLSHTGRNAFEGIKTQRIYATMTKTRACDDLATHPRMLALLDRMFMPNYLLSQLQVINILPDEDAQFLHHDDGFYPLPRPRPPLGAASIFAIDDFTQDNGATKIVPGSHLWGDRKASESEAIPAVMPKGSAIFYGGTFWHGGGANESDTSRLAITVQYCEPWVRQQENYTLGVPREIVKQLSPQLKSLLGYSILPPYIGMVDGVHPLKLLED